jgi:hypothetical protein
MADLLLTVFLGFRGCRVFSLDDLFDLPLGRLRLLLGVLLWGTAEVRGTLV